MIGTSNRKQFYGESVSGSLSEMICSLRDASFCWKRMKLCTNATLMFLRYEIYMSLGQIQQS